VEAETGGVYTTKNAMKYRQTTVRKESCEFVNLGPNDSKRKKGIDIITVTKGGCMARGTSNEKLGVFFRKKKIVEACRLKNSQAHKLISIPGKGGER